MLSLLVARRTPKDFIFLLHNIITIITVITQLNQSIYPFIGLIIAKTVPKSSHTHFFLHCTALRGNNVLKMKITTLITILYLTAHAAEGFTSNYKHIRNVRSFSQYNSAKDRHMYIRSSSRTKSYMTMNGGSGSPSPSELTSALARLDQQWEVTGRSSKKPTGGIFGWTKLILENDSNNDSDGEGTPDSMPKPQEEFVYLLEPPSTPSLVILFLGGAGLGVYV